MPIESLSALASGARQFVVHDAFEMMWCAAGSYWSEFTPMTNVASSFLAGAEMMTFLAPASMCAFALVASVKKPVDSMTMSAPSSPQGRFAGSRSASARIFLPSTMMLSSSKSTLSGKRPRTVSYLSRCASVLLSVRSFTPTISMSAPDSTMAR
ncbi:Uncharacterised protein [Mycobacteroides abscessus]|nr:Uncharacterised protein [Mycobacteroides abscessus]